MSQIFEKYIEENILKIGSYDLDHIFSNIKEDSFDEIEDTFNFELKIHGIKLNNFSKIEIPKNVKYKKLDSKFNSFKALYIFMEINKDNNMVSPYYGKDLLI